MQKAMKTPLIAKFIVLLVILGVMGCVGGPSPTPSAVKETPSVAPETKPPAGYKFTVNVPSNTPAYTTVYLEFVTDEGYTAGRPLRMNKKGPNVWEMPLTELPAKKYRYNRDGLGFESAEEFSLDARTAHRVVEKDVMEFNDVVEKWRWFPNPGEIVPDIPTEAGKITFEKRVDNVEFQKGVLFQDYWGDQFDDLIDPANKALKETGVTWVQIAAPWDYMQINPYPVLGEAGHSYGPAT